MTNGMIVKNNLAALSTLNCMNANNAAKTKRGKKVSSGMKINGVADDASGYQISERMRVQVRSLEQANQNAQNGTSLLKTAEGAVSSTVEILKTLKEKVINAANGHNTDEDRKAIQQELNQSIDQINENAAIQFNGKYLVNGDMSEATFSTANVLVNRSLDRATGTSRPLIQLKDRDGNPLNIQAGDTVAVSVEVNGRVVNHQFTVTPTSKIWDDMFYPTAGVIRDGIGPGHFLGTDKHGKQILADDYLVRLRADDKGLGHAITSVSVSVKDARGKERKEASKALSAFHEEIEAADASADKSMKLQVGVKSNQSIAVALEDMSARALGLQGEVWLSGEEWRLNIESEENATNAINRLDKALQKALKEQTKIGAIQSRLEYTSKNLTTASENVTNSESAVRDADMGKEMAEYTKNDILTRTAQAMLAQANQSTQSVLSLLN